MRLRKYLGENVYAEFKDARLVLTVEPDRGPPVATIRMDGVTFLTLLTWVKAVTELFDDHSR